jgi:hypothetical protein
MEYDVFCLGSERYFRKELSAWITPSFQSKLTFKVGDYG